jgi:hypothetical protein
MDPFLLHLRQFQVVSLFPFLKVYEVHQPYSLTSIYSFTIPSSTNTSSNICIYFTSYNLILIYKSIFKGFLSVFCFVYTLLWSVQHHLLLSLTP